LAYNIKNHLWQNTYIINSHHEPGRRSQVMITDDQLNVCANLLLSRQTELIAQVQDHFGLAESARDTTGELSNYDNHPADSGTELFERGKDLALNEHAEKELEEINEALHAINDGTYGICVACGADIDYDRLLAVPTADHCVNHAPNQVTDVSSRPIEEKVFSPNINPDPEEAIEEEHLRYDGEDAWQEVSQYGTSETPSDFYEDKDNYNEMYPNSDEHIGTTEDVESLLTANIEGKQSGFAREQQLYEDEDYL